MDSRYKNKKGEKVEVVVKVYTRPNLRSGKHEMLLYQGKHFLDNIFDIKKEDNKTTEVFIYYPETWANIIELRGLVDFVFHFYPNIQRLEITTHSVYIVQTVYSEHIRIYDQNNEYPETTDPQKHMSPPPESFNGLHVFSS